tara:strand:- start:73 stop:855 length:783 start_codon:yes stop_codon:yes gene_type:complete
MSLGNQKVKNAFKSLLRVNDNTNGIDTSLEDIQDGNGNKSAIKLSDDILAVEPQVDNGLTFYVKPKGETATLTVDTTNKAVKVGSGQDHATTQYAHFHINGTWWSSASANNHYPMAFNSSNLAGLPTFGTATDPATSFTTAEGSNTRASDIVPFLWYVPDAITIDSIHSMEGADTATGDTSRMHLMSYTFTNASTSCLTSGTVLGYNADISNAGSEQAYLSSWTVASPNVSAGKVILGFMRVDSTNSDYSASIFVKYHIQ